MVLYFCSGTDNTCIYYPKNHHTQVLQRITIFQMFFFNRLQRFRSHAVHWPRISRRLSGSKDRFGGRRMTKKKELSDEWLTLPSCSGAAIYISLLFLTLFFFDWFRVFVIQFICLMLRRYHTYYMIFNKDLLCTIFTATKFECRCHQMVIASTWFIPLRSVQAKCYLFWELLWHVYWVILIVLWIVSYHHHV